MIKFIKNELKKFLNYFGWKLTKNYKKKSYTNQKPNLELLEALHASKGVIHMGGHRGTEAAVYDWLHKKTLWFEANPKIFIDLKNHVMTFVNQKAYNILLYEFDDKEFSFNISNNDGASSSIYNFGEDSLKDDLKMIESVKLKSKKIDTFFSQEKFEPNDYDFWVMDIQGAELPVLKGADETLKSCKFIYIEVSRGNFYEEGTQWNELKNFLINNGFKNLWEPFNDHTDVLFKKIN